MLPLNGDSHRLFAVVVSNVRQRLGRRINGDCPHLMALATILACLGATAAPPYADGDLFADTWVATDALGRTQPGLAQAGPVKADR